MTDREKFIERHFYHFNHPDYKKEWNEEDRTQMKADLDKLIEEEMHNLQTELNGTNIELTEQVAHRDSARAELHKLREEMKKLLKSMEVYELKGNYPEITKILNDES